VTNPQGIHLRPAGKIVEACRKYPNCSFFISREGYEANAKSIMGVLALAVCEGESFTLRAEGPDNEIDLFFEEMQTVVDNNFYDDIV